MSLLEVRNHATVRPTDIAEPETVVQEQDYGAIRRDATFASAAGRRLWKYPGEAGNFLEESR